MARKTIIVCNWHSDDTVAMQHNTWRDLDGVERENDLCDSHQKTFLKAWETINKDADIVTTDLVLATPAIPSKRRKGRERSEATLVRAWAKSVGEPVSETGRVGFDVEMKWRDAGSPNVLDGAK